MERIKKAINNFFETGFSSYKNYILKNVETFTTEEMILLVEMHHYIKKDIARTSDKDVVLEYINKFYKNNDAPKEILFFLIQLNIDNSDLTTATFFYNKNKNKFNILEKIFFMNVFFNVGYGKILDNKLFLDFFEEVEKINWRKIKKETTVEIIKILEPYNKVAFAEFKTTREKSALLTKNLNSRRSFFAKEHTNLFASKETFNYWKEANNLVKDLEITERHVRLFSFAKEMLKSINSAENMVILGQAIRIKVHSENHEKWNKIEKIVPKSCELKDELWVFNNEGTNPNILGFPAMLYASSHGIAFDVAEKRKFFHSKTNNYINHLDEFTPSTDGWKIDLKNKEIIKDGVNYYHGIYEFVTRRQYDFFLHDDVFSLYKVHLQILECDRAIKWISSVNDFAVKNSVKVKFFSYCMHYPYTSAVWNFCKENELQNVDIIHETFGYVNLFDNWKREVSNRACYMNLSKNESSRLAMLGNYNDFELYKLQNQDFSIPKKFSEISPAYDGKLTKELQAYKNTQKKVVLVLGKIPFDMAYYRPNGLIFDDMAEWINDIVEFANHSETIFLIKPHPLEMNRNVTYANDGMVGLLDLINSELPKNCLVVDSTKYSNDDLLNFVDLTVCWTGSAAFEMPAKGKPIICMESCAFHDYPIGLPVFKNIDEYHEVLNGEKEIFVNNELKENAQKFISYLGSDWLMPEVKFIQFSLTNYDMLKNADIFEEEAQNYLNNGDYYLDKVFEKI